MNTLMFDYTNGISNMFRELEAMMNFDFREASRGLKKIIKRPHNLITKKDDSGNTTEFALEVVYTPFKKDEVSVEVMDNILSVKCGAENKYKDASMDYCGISYQSSEFSIPLSEQIDIDSIKATAEDGMLRISLPVKKIVEEDKKEPIKIKVG